MAHSVALIPCQTMQTLSATIRDEVGQSGGWIGFDVFMGLALYAPGLGYYCGGGRPFGGLGSADPVDSGDFLTAPMLGPWLAEAIWHWARPLASQADPFRIREFGGGRGDLAAALLSCAQRDQITCHLEEIELSADLQALQRQATGSFKTVRWSQTLSDGFSGLVIANEVLDAMPVKCFEWVDAQTVLEWGVEIDSDRTSDGSEFRWAARPASAGLSAVVQQRHRNAEALGLHWDSGYRGEYNPRSAAWLNSLSESIDSGAIVLIDYGFMRPELDHPGRTTGSLCAHYRHQRIDDFDELLKRVGEQDLTAHVDFSQLCSEAERAGFQVNGLVTQARFLINVGILESAQNILDQTADTISRTRHQQALHQLLSEPEMGERFKVMLLTKNLDSARRQTLIEKGFLAGDRLGK